MKGITSWEIFFENTSDCEMPITTKYYTIMGLILYTGRHSSFGPTSISDSSSVVHVVFI